MGKKSNPNTNPKAARKNHVIKKRRLAIYRTLSKKLASDYTSHDGTIGTKWEAGVSRGNCCICKRNEPARSRCISFYNFCDCCRRLVCEKCRYIVYTGYPKPTQTFSCANQHDGINHPNTFFCGLGCGCLDKERIFVCIDCNKKRRM